MQIPRYTDAMLYGGDCSLLFTNPLVEGRFISRLNRFIAEVAVAGCLEHVHVPNTGRLQELLVPDALVYLTPVRSTMRKTSWDLTLVEKDGVLCAIDTRLPSQLLVEPETLRVLNIDTGSKLKLEAPYGEHRFDLKVEDAIGQIWVEAKTVSLVVDKNAYFPDAPTVRGSSHLNTLAQIVQSGGRGALVFMLLRDDAGAVYPNRATDPVFADALRRAEEAGVLLKGIRYHVSLAGIAFAGELPVLTG